MPLSFFVRADELQPKHMLGNAVLFALGMYASWWVQQPLITLFFGQGVAFCLLGALVLADIESSRAR